MPLSLRPWEKDLVPIVQEAGWMPGPIWIDAKNLPPAWVRSLGRPSHRESLYYLHYPGPWISLPQNYISEKRNVCIFYVFIAIYVSGGVASL